MTTVPLACTMKIYPTLSAFILQHLRQTIMEKFDSATADQLFEDTQGMPVWLDTLSEEPFWRTMLIELFDAHRDSVLLRFLLKRISTQGHHREIAAIVSGADIFHVFKGVLQDQLGQVMEGNECQMATLTLDIQRTCCSTAYMFLYSQEVLMYLEDVCQSLDRRDCCLIAGAKQRGVVDNDNDNDQRDGVCFYDTSLASVCARKFRRLRQDLITHAVCPMAEKDTSVEVFRRSAFAHRLTEYHQVQAMNASPSWTLVMANLLAGGETAKRGPGFPALTGCNIPL
eukprot:330059_1